MTSIESYADFFESHKDVSIVICGGDGTLNRFVNDVSDVEIKSSIYFYPCGSGNDFHREIKTDADEPICIDKYIKDLPVCTVNGKEFKFINGIGYGIDGYCCEVGDKLRLESSKPINYTSIAIKGLLFHYKPTNATVIVDGVEHTFKKVWIAPTMKGWYYGGGINPAPAQDRKDPDGKVSLTVFHGSGRLKTLIIFPNLFKGTHVSKKKNISIFTGKEITVKFESPRALQVDGETVLDVTEYTVKA
jgi:diacylglycerol kinase family enzyme